LGAGIVVVGPSVLAEVQRNLRPSEVPASRDAYYLIFRDYYKIMSQRPGTLLIS
jgi:hypothetical protein